MDKLMEEVKQDTIVRDAPRPQLWNPSSNNKICKCASRVCIFYLHIMEAPPHYGGRYTVMSWCKSYCNGVAQRKHQKQSLSCIRCGTTNLLLGPKDVTYGIEWTKKNTNTHLFWKNPKRAIDVYFTLILFWYIFLVMNYNGLILKIPLANPWDAPHADEWDNTTMKEYIDRLCWTQ